MSRSTPRQLGGVPSKEATKGTCYSKGRYCPTPQKDPEVSLRYNIIDQNVVMALKARLAAADKGVLHPDKHLSLRRL